MLASLIRVPGDVGDPSEGGAGWRTPTWQTCDVELRLGESGIELHPSATRVESTGGPDCAWYQMLVRQRSSLFPAFPRVALRISLPCVRFLLLTQRTKIATRMDVCGDMETDIFDSMAQGVEGACCVVCFSSVASVGWGSWLAGFALAWSVGLVVPGAPGGLGVFELVLLARLSGAVPEAEVLAVLVSYRLISVAAELLAAGGVELDRRQRPSLQG